MARYSVLIAAAAAVFCVADARAQLSPDDAAILNDPSAGRSIPDRESAARRLANLHTPAAVAALNTALSGANGQAQLAAVRSLQFVGNPDPSLIPAIRPLLGSNPTLTEPAARALVNYTDLTDPTAAVENFVRTGAVEGRSAAVRALGGRSDKETARFLIDLYTDPATKEDVRTAAAEALSSMTGLSTDGLSRGWDGWWQSHANMADGPFRAELATGRDRRAAAERARKAVAVEELQRALKITFDQLTPAQKVDILSAYLANPSAEVRVVALDLAKGYASEQRIPPAMAGRVRDLLSDDDDAVRDKAVELLALIQDPNAVGPLVIRATLEKNPAIRAKIADTLGQINDTTAAGALLTLVQDSRPEIAITAAKAFGGLLGETLRKGDPARADAISEKLRYLLDNPPAGTGDPFRASLVDALASLRDRRSLQKFRDLLEGDRQPVDIRRKALLGLGNLADPRAEQSIVNEFEDKDATIRLAAVTAFKPIASKRYIDPLYRLVGDNDPTIAAQAWEDFKTLFPKMDSKELSEWANRFKDNNPQKYLDTLLAWAAALEAEKKLDDLADRRQDIAHVWMTLKQPDRAVESLQHAVDYWATKGKDVNYVPLNGLTGDMIDDLCAARRYADAAAFGQRQIKFDKSYTDVVGSRLKNKVNELLQAGDKADAKSLADESLKMNPPLSENIRGQLERFRSEAEGQ